MKEWLRGAQKEGYISANDLDEYCELESSRPIDMLPMHHQVHCLEIVGYGIAPDPRFVPWIKSNTNPMFLYGLSNKTINNLLRSEMKKSILEISLAVITLKARGNTSDIILLDLENKVEHHNKFLTMGSERLLCHLRWLLKSQPGPELIPLIAKNLNQFGYRNISELENFVEYTVINGFVHRERLPLIEKVYSGMKTDLNNYHYSLDNQATYMDDDSLPTYVKALTKKIVNFSNHTQKDYQGWQQVDKTSTTYWNKGNPGIETVDSSKDLKKREKSKVLQWVPKASEVNIAGRRMKGMVYVGKHSRLKEFDQFYCSACIDPSLRVGKPNITKDTTKLAIKPSYLRLDPNSRASYMNWLQTDRSDIRGNAGFSKLYWYGLEYRFFVDNPSVDEKREILAEVRRVYEAYDRKDQYILKMRTFINYAAVLIGDEELFPTTKQNEEDSLFTTLIVVARQLANGKPINADWCLSWYLNQPETHSNYTMKRLPFEFRLYYKYLFNKKYGIGLKIKRPQGIFTTYYTSSSEEFVQELEFTLNGVPLPDVDRLKKPLKEIKSIVFEAATGLKSYMRFFMKNEDKRYSLEAMTRLPKEIQGDVWLDRLRIIRESLTDQESSKGLLLASLLERLEGCKRDKITKRQYDEISHVLGHTGYGLSPHPRLLVRAPKLDEKVFIYPIDEKKNKKSELKESLLDRIVEIEVGVWLGISDEDQEMSVSEVLARHIETNSQLDDQERRILSINLQWFLSSAGEISKYKRWFAEMTSERKEKLRRTSLSICQSYGESFSNALPRLETLYSLLGYESHQVYSDVYAGKAIDGPISVREAIEGPEGESIPIDSNGSKTVSLDSKKIDALVDETGQVRHILGGIFAENSQPGQQKSENVSTVPNLASGLDRKHASLVMDFLKKDHWTESAIEKLAKKHGLMWQGSLEVINEWSFDLCEDELIEEYKGYRPNPNALEKLKKLIVPKRNNK